ncbi:MAG: hydrogenase 4 subunit F [Candidatus Omnitrophica bacterium]|nr:hydrogenase 4 subunit F [Candidatus Omnitrophota bacterium]
MLIYFVLGIPLVLTLAVFLLPRARHCGLLNSIGYAVVLNICIFMLLKAGSIQAVSLSGFFYLDALSLFFIFVISVVTFAAALYSISFIDKDLKAGVISERKAKFYYAFFNLFCFSMFFVPAVNNLGMLWVAIEMTTLVSAFLVGFYNTKQSVEAAWKYIIICSVGIVFALLGIILFSYAFSNTGGIKSLNWSYMVSAAWRFDPNIVKIAFIFILVGFGTKAGLAPMHTWLPDAHSQAVAPISALLSGVLLKTAIYAILRFAIITNKALGTQFCGNLMLFLGLLSLAVACVFLLVQKDLKRLLAYSSIEHIGIISLGFGLGTSLGFLGALLHVFNHAVNKSLMFFSAGDIVASYKKHNMNAIRGVIKALPFCGVMAILGTFALTGVPPFSIFMSEIIIIFAAFLKGNYLACALLLLFIAVIFGALIYHLSKVLFGHKPKEMAVTGEPLSAKIAFIFLFIQISIVGILLPWIFRDGMWLAIKVLQGV